MVANRKKIFDLKTRNAEREQVKALVSMLPSVKIVSTKEDYLRTLDDADRRRFLLREYFDGLRRKRPVHKMDRKLKWVVAAKPFPQIFEYKEGDEELFKTCQVVKFTNFLSAYKLYMSFLRFELKRARQLSSAAHYKNPRTP